jgi:hypothetical protein
MNKQERFEARLNATGLGNVRDDGDIHRYEGLTAGDARWLLDIGAAEADDAQNSAPTFGEIVEWLEEHPSFVAHGYVVSPKRSDERITIEGVCSARGARHSKEDLVAFAQKFHRADEFDISNTRCRAWYD